MEALGLVLCTVFSLSFDEVEELALEEADALLKVARNDEVDVEVDPASDD